MSESQRIAGIVLWFNPQYENGQITADDGRKFHVYRLDIETKGRRKLKAGESVSFEPKRIHGMSTMLAVKVRRMN